MANSVRLKKISDRIREELSDMLVRQVADPRLAGVSVTDVRVDRELAYADIFVSTWEGHERADEIVAALRHAAGFLRTELAARVDLRSMPRLRFHWDPTPERADHIEKLLLEIRSEREMRESQQDAASEEHEGEEGASPEGEADE